MVTPDVIQISVDPRCREGANLFLILEDLLPVKFGAANDLTSESSGLIQIEGDAGPSAEQNVRIPSLTVPQSDDRSGEVRWIKLAVQFSDDQYVPFPYRGRSIETNVAVEPKALSLRPDERPLLTCDKGVLWACSERAGAKHYRSAFPIVALPKDGSFQNAFGARRFLELLPLVHWLREMCSASEFDGPPLRACFIFDDPNLHAPRYGFVDFREIATRAEKENYHVCFATIPLDAWFTHGKTAALFRQSSTRLSLAIHGNDHIKQELARNYTSTERKALLWQAIRRIEKLERNAGLQVSRIMIPPHGACSEEMLSEMPECGFKGASISHGSLRAHNKNRPWTRSLGYAPVEMVRGCPVMPRWGFSEEANSAMLLAAFLNQPLILRGHHQDLRHGNELLDQHARFINGLGRPILWSNLEDLSQHNFQWRLEGSLCNLKPLSRAFSVEVPAQTSSLMVSSSCNGTSHSWRLSGAGGESVEIPPNKQTRLPTGAGRGITLEKVTAPIDSKVEIPRFPKAPALIRRLLTESRDRFVK